MKKKFSAKKISAVFFFQPISLFLFFQISASKWQFYTTVEENMQFIIKNKNKNRHIKKKKKKKEMLR